MVFHAMGRLRSSKQHRINLNASGNCSVGTVHYNLSIGKRDYDIFFKSQGQTLYSGIEPILLLALLPAMRISANILISQPVRTDLVENLSRFMEIFGTWYKDFRKVRIIVENIANYVPTTRTRVGAFFTGGVDSFYTLLKHRDEITDLVYVHGFDVALEDHARRQTVSEMCFSVAEGFGKGLVEVETNARRLLKGFTHWGKHAHGAALASVGHILSSEFSKIYIPASRFPDGMLISWGSNPPWGSHPETDPLLGDSAIELVHDGMEARRTEKLEAICGDQRAMKHLRICWMNVQGTYNCGKCEKCLRTMITLQTLGQLGSCETLPHTIDLQTLRRSLLTPGPELEFLRENLLLLIARGFQNTPIASAIKEVINRPVWSTKLLIAALKSKRKLTRLFSRHK